MDELADLQIKLEQSPSVQPPLNENTKEKDEILNLSNDEVCEFFFISIKL